jgi:hypothetical protein
MAKCFWNMRLQFKRFGGPTLVLSMALMSPNGMAQTNSDNTAKQSPNIRFVHPEPTPPVTNNTVTNNPSTAQDGTEQVDKEPENVTNNYYGYGWPDPFWLGPCLPGERVTNYFNGAPVYFGYGYPYVGYGSTGYGPPFNGYLGFPHWGYPGVINAGPLQPNFNQPRLNPAGFPWPGMIGDRKANAPVAAGRAVQPAVFPRAIDAVPANPAVTEIQRRVDVLKPSTPEGRLRADRLIAQGDVSFAAQRYGVASSKYQDAMAKAPDYPTSHFRLAHCDIASGNFDLALTRFLMALELAGSAQRVNFSLEQLYQGDKFAKQTHIDRLQDAIQREPDDGGLVFLMGLTLHYDQNPVQARGWFVKSQSMPGTHQAYVHFFLPVVPIAEPAPIANPK